MLKLKFTFIHMAHSDAMENHAREKLPKLTKLLNSEELPQDLEVRFKSNPHGASNEVELNLVTKNFRNCFQCTDSEMYEAFDQALEKLISWLKKEKDKLKTKLRKVKTIKNDF